MDELTAAFPNTDKTVLQRFLKSADGKVDGPKGAAEAVQKHLKWKESLPGMSEMYQSSLVELEKKKLYKRGRDKAGHVILWWQTSNNDPKKRDLPTMIMAAIYFILMIERDLDEAAAKGEDAEMSVVVDRVDNVLDLPFVLKILPIFQDNCPERLGYLYICPASFLFRALWAIIRPLMNKKTQDKVKMLASGEDLMEYIAKDQMPTRMSGTDAFEMECPRDLPQPPAEHGSEFQA